MWWAENTPPKCFCYLDLLSFILACNTLCVYEHAITIVISKLLALHQVSFHILLFSHSKEGKYNLFTFVQREAWNPAEVLCKAPTARDLHNWNIMFFTPQYFSVSAIPTSHQCAPGVTSPAGAQWLYFRSAPMNPKNYLARRTVPTRLLRLLLQEKVPHLSETWIRHRSLYWPTSVPALSFMNPTPRTTRRGTHISTTIHSTITFSCGGLSVPWENPETHTKKLIART